MSDAPNLSNLPPPDAIATWIREYRTQRRKCDEEQGVLRNICKRAKADGVNVKAMTDAVAATKKDPDVVRQDTRDAIYYMNIARIPIDAASLYQGWQPDVTDRTRAQDDEFHAQEAGYRAGRNGVPYEDCPHAPGTELHQQWSVFWNRGQAAIAREMGPDEKQAPTTRERPTRAARAEGPKEPRKAKGAKSSSGRSRGRPSRRLSDLQPSA